MRIAINIDMNSVMNNAMNKKGGLVRGNQPKHIHGIIHDTIHVHVYDYSHTHILLCHDTMHVFFMTHLCHETFRLS